MKFEDLVEGKKYKTKYTNVEYIIKKRGLYCVDYGHYSYGHYSFCTMKEIMEMEFEEIKEIKEVPKLSDTERVILENMNKEISEICKSRFGTLYVVEVEAYNTFEIDIYDHLFEFIKRGETYLIEDLLNNN